MGRQSPGEYLRKLREEKGHTHAAVGTALHLTVHYIKALESDEYGKLPGLTFVKGYLRSYARFLGADVDNVLARFDEHITGLLDAGMHTARVERSKRRQDQALRWAVGAGFVVIAALAVGWWVVSGGQDAPEAAQPGSNAAQAATVNTAPPVASSTLAPRATPTATFANTLPPAAVVTTAVTAAAPDAVAPQSAMPMNSPQSSTAEATADVTDAVVSAPANPALTTEASSVISAPVVTALPSGSRNVSLVANGNDELRVRFNGNSWIEVDDASMVRLYNDMLRTGDTLTIRGVAPFHVLFGDASQVAVSLNAAPVDISAGIRNDSTARLVLAAPAAAPASTPAAEVAPATEQTTAQEVPQ
jgi:cytoskeleton protein RodZ